MNVHFSMAIGDRPAWLAPLQHSERSPFYIPFFKETIEELFGPRFHTPVIRMHCCVTATHPALENGGKRQGADHFPYCVPAGWVPFGELKRNRLVLPLIETYNKNALPDLRDTKVLRIKFPFENREACGSKKLLEIAEQFRVCLVFEAKHIFKNEEIQSIVLVQFREDVSVILWQFQARVIRTLVYVAHRECLARWAADYSYGTNGG